MDKKIILKVKQLLALADGTDNISEAINAAQAASRLMREYNLTRESLNTSNEDEAFLDYGEKLGRPWLGIRNPDELIQCLAGMLAAQNNCGCYMSRWVDDVGEFSGLSIVGRPVDIVATETVFWFLMPQILILEEKQKVKNKTSFWFGAMHGLKNRLDDLKGDFTNLNLNESQIRNALTRINQSNQKIHEYIASIANDGTKERMIDVKDFDLGYVSSKKIQIERRKELN